MQHNTYLIHYIRQSHGPLPSPSKSLPQRPKMQPPLQGTFHAGFHPGARLVYSTNLTTPPTSSPIPQNNTTNGQQPSTAKPEPAQYTLEDGPRDALGTAAYYKSWVFRKKVIEGTTRVTGQEAEAEAGENIDDSADENYHKKSKQVDRTKSLVLIFSRTNVRRANAQRKVNERIQRANRRSKFLRNLERAECCFGWD
ncbi:hypothetical protein BU25DRAFT_469591 [Macroventuria anomochaeta]|uniref:Uncharacterized protein n=1 Tax=Macroventuria anomochaeta TaxID=301207 RepID=A0ACB6RYP6_9PLEO|nr:uncharacterized protein BU25DRAFT_469591 [Macroventuria anomochaeta]KAF2627155.1 hypothetical protein BU25DRAFT_469591 [Macroventuria anomochaeta]